MNGLDLLGPDQRGLFIGGAWREAEGGERLDVIDPADGSVLTDVADGSVNDAVDALDAAVAAQAAWAATPPRERGEILRTAFGLITDRADEFAHLMSLEMGKTVAEARGEVGYGAEFFRWYAEEAVRIHGRWMQAPGRRQPAADHQEARRPLPLHHPVELPAGDGHPQDRARPSPPAARWSSSRPARRR